MSTPRRIAIVTGAGSGIGRAVALALLHDGYAVALVGRRAEALAATKELAGEHGASALTVPCDVTDPAAVRSLFDRVMQEFRRVDLLFNNAGIGAPPVPLDELGDAQWRSVVDVNLSGAFWCMREAFRVMKAQSPRGGRIINNGSISAHTPRPNSAPYTATKHAIAGLTKSGALDGRAHNIAVSQIDIGNAATELTERMSRGVPQANGTMAPEPTMDVQHVARTVLHMAGLPLDANMLFVTIMATQMPFVGRG
ncbi:MAG: SDR family oxidoreductase [Planctomycetes bacterium]|nr:SDR family oxidoreductase [Planctomycetota bacterium]